MNVAATGESPLKWPVQPQTIGRIRRRDNRDNTSRRRSRGDAADMPIGIDFRSAGRTGSGMSERRLSRPEGLYRNQANGDENNRIAIAHLVSIRFSTDVPNLLNRRSLVKLIRMVAADLHST